MTGHSSKTKLYSFHPETCEDEKIVFACGSLMDVPKYVGFQGNGRPLVMQMELTAMQSDLFRAALKTLGARYYYDVHGVRTVR